VTGLDAPRIGEIAAANRIVLHELAPQLGSLEEAFMEMTADSVEYGGDTPAVPQETAASTTSPGSSQ
jgi:ABC-2 type transport system ATP-binding protein